MIDFNQEEFNQDEIKIFNGGKAGFVQGVNMTITKKSSDDHVNAPDYNIVISNDSGEVKQGFYYEPSSQNNPTKEQIETHQKNVASRLHTIAKKTVEDGYVFPKVNSYKEGIDMLANIIRENSVNKKFNCFVTYGSTSYPKKYLELRYFNSIARENETLVARASDQLERIEADSNSQDVSGVSSNLGDSWLS